jgi:hypothetical protein
VAAPYFFRLDVEKRHHPFQSWGVCGLGPIERLDFAVSGWLLRLPGHSGLVLEDLENLICDALVIFNRFGFWVVVNQELTGTSCFSHRLIRSDRVEKPEQPGFKIEFTA